MIPPFGMTAMLHALLMQAFAHFMTNVASAADHGPELKSQVLGDLAPSFARGPKSFHFSQRIRQGRVGLGVGFGEFLLGGQPDRDLPPSLTFGAEILHGGGR